MKKVITVFDGTNYSKGAIAFAAALNRQAPILLAGSFLPQLDLSSSWSYAGGAARLHNPLLEDFNAEEVEENIRRFREDCDAEGIEYRVHSYPFELAIPEVRKESRFADLLLLGGETFYHQFGTEHPNEYLRMTVQESECPVVIVPETFEFPENVVIAYDGSEDAVYAIRQFALLFPELAKKPTILVNATSKEHGTLPEKDYIVELCARHYPDLTVRMLEGTPRRQFNAWLSGRPASILVCGAYGRSDLSMMFRRSFAAGAILEHKFPIFIAHRS